MENTNPEVKDTSIDDICISFALFNQIFVVINEYEEELAHYLHVFGRRLPPHIKQRVEDLHRELEFAMDRSIEKEKPNGL
jgi:hypothetical protein